MPAVVPVILAGGKGERFWPLSRQSHPKQFLKILPGGKSLIRATAERLVPLAHGWDGLFVATSRALAGKILEELPELPLENLILEPEPKDTGAAVAWVTLQIAERLGEDAVIGLFPADHHIAPAEGLREAISHGAGFAEKNTAILTFGISPTHPATGYGYIERGEVAGMAGELSVFKVARFTEKPDLATAEAYLDTERFYWNSGIFVFRAQTMLEELARHAPSVIGPLEALGAEGFRKVPRISIDYAVMERTKRAFVIPAPFTWDDLGDWTALERLLGSEGRNVELAKHIGIDTNGAIIYATAKDEIVVTLGLEDVVIVRDGNVTLVAKKSRIQDIKSLLKRFRQEQGLENLT